MACLARHLYFEVLAVALHLSWKLRDHGMSIALGSTILVAYRIVAVVLRSCLFLFSR